MLKIPVCLLYLIIGFTNQIFTNTFERLAYFKVKFKYKNTIHQKQ